jgi:hypothetical protein
MKVRHPVLTMGQAVNAELVELPSMVSRDTNNLMLQLNFFGVKIMAAPPGSDHELVSATPQEEEQLQKAGYMLKRAV